MSDAVGRYWMQLTPLGARSRESRYCGMVSQSHLIPAFIASYGIASARVMVSIERSRKSGLTGTKPKPQLPSTTEQTPCQPEKGQYDSTPSCASRWVRQSPKPG